MSPIASPEPAVPIPDVDLPTFLLEGAARCGDRPAYVDGPSGRVVTHSAIGPMAARFAAALAERGFGHGDVLAILAPNLPEWPVAMLGAQLAGGAVTPVNPLCTVDEIAHQLRDSRARVVLTVGTFLEKARAAAGAAEAIVLGDAPAGTVTFGARLAGDAPVPRVRINPATDVAMLPYSSGTTGLPKGVRLTHRNLVANVCQAQALLAPTPADVVIGVLPFFHAAGFCSSICLTLRAGATVVTQPRFDLEECLALVERHRATVLPAAPPVVLALARHPAVDRYDLSSLELVICGSAPLSAELEAECAARLGRPVLQVYGLTETSPIVSLSRRDGRDHTPGGVGTLVPNTQARLVDPASGADLGPGETGELWVRGPQVMAGYQGDPEATAATIDADGWLRTGDLGTVTAGGEVFVLDRVKELIKVSGFQVAPAELEALVGRHPAVADVAVVGRPDERAGERPVAYVVARGELDPAALIAWAAERSAGYKRLADVAVLDAIPRSPAGKILRRVLRDGVGAPA
ncbi:MAG TPA: AMP-binding protein [Pseudonocardia sp.]|nr:AMP-binding protein [Pseudonocardia sp.]